MGKANLKERIKLEREFWNEKARKLLEQFNPEKERMIVERTLKEYSHLNAFEIDHQTIKRLGDVRGKKVLVLGSAQGHTAIMLALKGAEICAIDISDLMITYARKVSSLFNTPLKVRFYVMPAEKLKFKTNTFDIAVALASLHHFKWPTCLSEISSVLKQGGKLIACEPFVGSKLLQYVRKFIPLPTYESPCGRQLTPLDLKIIANYFKLVNCEEFEFLARLERFVPRFLKPRRTIGKLFRVIDHELLKKSYWLRPYARCILIEATK